MPKAMPPYDSIYDKKGDEYRIYKDHETEEMFRSRIAADFGEIWVGELHWDIKIASAEMILRDISIREMPLMTRPKRAKVPIVGRYWKPPTFYHRGIGSAMMRYTIEYATRRGLKSIEGFITKDDLAKTPTLLCFYLKHGFSIAPIIEAASSDCAWIYRDIA